MPKKSAQKDDSESLLLRWQTQASPFYTEGHRKYREHVRKFVEKEVTPYAEKWNSLDTHPNFQDFARKIANYGGIWMFPFGFTDEWNGYKWDPFYTIVFSEEWGKPVLNLGVHIFYVCLKPLQLFGRAPIHKECLSQVMKGNKNISLAISELTGGSDVSQIKTTAKLDESGNNYIINGNKYWITGGHRAHYFLTLVRTGSEGRFGVSLILIPRTKGVFTSKLNLQGLELNDTAAVTFANVVVPKENIVGSVNQGFIPLMINFNNERFGICCGVVPMLKTCVEESISWAKERYTFGKPLIKHQVIRDKIATMARETLACHAMLEYVAYQIQASNKKDYKDNDKGKSIAMNCAMLKVQCTKTLQFCTVEASQIFGGRSFVKGGRGAKIERLYRSVRGQSVGGGSEEILQQLAIRQAKL